MSLPVGRSRTYTCHAMPTMGHIRAETELGFEKYVPQEVIFTVEYGRGSLTSLICPSTHRFCHCRQYEPKGPSDRSVYFQWEWKSPHKSIF